MTVEIMARDNGLIVTVTVSGGDALDVACRAVKAAIESRTTTEQEASE